MMLGTTRPQTGRAGSNNSSSRVLAEDSGAIRLACTKRVDSRTFTLELARMVEPAGKCRNGCTCCGHWLPLGRPAFGGDHVHEWNERCTRRRQRGVGACSGRDREFRRCTHAAIPTVAATRISLRGLSANQIIASPPAPAGPTASLARRDELHHRRLLRGDRPVRPQASPRHRIENDGRNEQTERENDEHRVNGMAQELYSAFHNISLGRFVANALRQLEGVVRSHSLSKCLDYDSRLSLVGRASPRRLAHDITPALAISDPC